MPQTVKLRKRPCSLKGYLGSILDSLFIKKHPGYPFLLFSPIPASDLWTNLWDMLAYIGAHCSQAMHLDRNARLSINCLTTRLCRWLFEHSRLPRLNNDYARSTNLISLVPLKGLLASSLFLFLFLFLFFSSSYSKTSCSENALT